jgi:hypothetical protein
MPVITQPSEGPEHLDRLTPKSLLRHRPITPQTAAKQPPPVPRASRSRASRTQTRRPASKQSTTPASVEVPTWKQASKTNTTPSTWHPRLLPGIGIGMVLAVLLVMLTQLLIGWIGNLWNDLHYGYPRTYQIDAVVGHHDSATHPSHFLALNLHGQIEIIEWPGGDASHVKIYLGPHAYGAQADLVPVTLRFIDARHGHQPDMVVLFQGEQVVFRNADGLFHAPSAPA